MQQPVALSWFVGLAALFVLKHFIADFLLQTGWMASGKERSKNWAIPLAVHAGIHGAATVLVCAAVAPRLVWLGGVDFVVHSVIDRGKALATRAAGADTEQAIYWWILGLDQTLHQLTNLGFAFALVAARFT